MSDVLYSIKNLICSYDGKNPVLIIEELEILKGKQTVFVGKSGAGKSTLLETLGLMNRTILEGEILFLPENGSRISLKELWQDEKDLANIRNRYYSFIFQSTNLMKNFSAYENACIPQMIQGLSLEEAMKNVTGAMARVGLGQVSHQEKVTQLSGGQQQRLAFVRAVTPEFAVLFGDEPTGNLDEKNAGDLMKFIESDVHQKQRSSILVSHNIDLSLEFADQIILLVKGVNDEYGKVSKENIFLAKNDNETKKWYTPNGNNIGNMRDLLLKNLM